VQAATGRVEIAKPDWQRNKQKLGSYEVLQARGDAVEAQQHARREQRDADEHAARILRMRAEGA
jgi:flagellar FliJ protein